MSETPNQYTLEEYNLRLDYVAVHPYEESDEVYNDTGIIIPGGAKKFDKWQNGRVIKTGPGEWIQNVRNKMTVEVGDRVTFHINDGENAFKSVTLDGKKCYIIKETKLMMAFKEIADE